MPRYDYDCSRCGRFERVARYEDAVVTCDDCGEEAVRQAVYVEQGVIFSGGGFTKSVLPPPGAETQHEMFKEVRKRGWDGARAVEEIRKNTKTGEDGKRYLDVASMPKTA